MNDLSFTENISTNSSNSNSATQSTSSSTTNSLNRKIVDFEIDGEQQRRRERRSSLNDDDDAEFVTIEYCKNEITQLKNELNEKNNEIFKLNDIRERLESEIRDLTAVLFEQAYNLVHKAQEETIQANKLLDKSKEETAQANKLLNEANGKCDILEAELNALKLILSSHHSNNNSNCPSSSPFTSNALNSSIVDQQHQRLRSFTQLNENLNIASSSPLSILNSNNAKQQHHHHHKRTISHSPSPSVVLNINRSNDQIHEIDPIYFKEIVLWRENPDINTNINNTFYTRVYNEDILPCISFNNKTLTDQLLESIKSNNVCIEDISKSHPIETMQICSLTNIPSICQYKIKFNCNETKWYLISKLCRNRIISVCDFFTYMKYMKDGLVKAENRDVYWTIIDLRKQMSLSRLGL